jgi:hypothetical protein
MAIRELPYCNNEMGKVKDVIVLIRKIAQHPRYCEGDTVVVHRIDRLARNLDDLRTHRVRQGKPGPSLEPVAELRRRVGAGEQEHL